MGLSAACPSCKKSSLSIHQASIKCSTSNCDWTVPFSCPLCSASLHNAQFGADEFGPTIQCSSCEQSYHTQRIEHLLNNRYRINYDKRCNHCHSPTYHLPNCEEGHRCLFFPKCKTQSSLFGAAPEEFVFLDFETTGLDPSVNHIIEIGALKIDQHGFEHHYETLIKPPETIPPKISDITNITNDMVSDAPVIADKIKEFSDFIGNAIIVAHNAEFDLPWLICQIKRNGLPTLQNDTLCTLKWAKQNKEPKRSLGVLTKKYGISHQNAHRALADVIATKELFFILEGQKKSPRPINPMTIYENIANKYLAFQAH